MLSPIQTRLIDSTVMYPIRFSAKKNRRLSPASSSFEQGSSYDGITGGSILGYIFSAAVLTFALSRGCNGKEYPSKPNPMGYSQGVK